MVNSLSSLFYFSCEMENGGDLFHVTDCVGLSRFEPKVGTIMRVSYVELYQGGWRNKIRRHSKSLCYSSNGSPAPLLANHVPPF